VTMVLQRMASQPVLVKNPGRASDLISDTFIFFKILNMIVVFNKKNPSLLINY